MTLLNVSHWKQHQQADCLAACCAMVLQYLQVPFDYDDLVALLETQFYGTAFSNMHKLEGMGMYVSTGEWGGVEALETYLSTGLPILVSVDTKELAYWNREASHVMVVIGLEDNFIIVNDPAFSEAPKEIPLGDFLLAWDEQYQRYGAVGLDLIEPNTAQK